MQAVGVIQRHVTGGDDAHRTGEIVAGVGQRDVVGAAGRQRGGAADHQIAGLGDGAAVGGDIQVARERQRAATQADAAAVVAQRQVTRGAGDAGREIAAGVVQRGVHAAEVEGDQTGGQRAAGGDVAAGGEVQAGGRQRADVEPVGIAQRQRARRAIDGAEIVAGLVQRGRIGAGGQCQRTGRGGARLGQCAPGCELEGASADIRCAQGIAGRAGEISRAVAAGAGAHRGGREVDAAATAADVPGQRMRGHIQGAAAGIDAEDVAAAVGVAAGMDIDRGGTVDRQGAAQRQQAGAVAAAEGQAGKTGLDVAAGAVPEIALRQIQVARARAQADAAADAVGLDGQGIAGLEGGWVAWNRRESQTISRDRDGARRAGTAEVERAVQIDTASAACAAGGEVDGPAGAGHVETPAGAAGDAVTRLPGLARRRAGIGRGTGGAEVDGPTGAAQRQRVGEVQRHAAIAAAGQGIEGDRTAAAADAEAAA